MTTYILANRQFPKFVSYLVFRDGLIPILLLQFRDRKKLLKDILRSSVIHNSDPYYCIPHFATPYFDIGQSHLFYFLVFLKHLAGLNGRAGVADLRGEIITIKER
jgi:hypothetical protein